MQYQSLILQFILLNSIISIFYDMPKNYNKDINCYNNKKNKKYARECRKTNELFAHLQHHKIFLPLGIIRKGQSVPKANAECLHIISICLLI